MLRFVFPLLFSALLCGSGAAGAQELQPVPQFSARVTDLTATLSEDQRTGLEVKLADFERDKGTQIAVLLVPTTQPEAIEAYSLRVAEAWKLGRKKVDDGALLIVAKQDRKLRIEVGYGLEGALNDAASKRIVSDVMAPHFKQGDFFGGIDAGIDAMIAAASGEALPAPPPQGEEDNQALALLPALPVILVFILFGGRILRLAFGRLPGAAATAAVAGGVSWLPLSYIDGGGMMAGIAAVIAFIVTLSGSDQQQRSGGSSWRGISSWSSGSSSSSSSSSDDFSGGGGDFGGGGASGDW